MKLATKTVHVFYVEPRADLSIPKKNVPMPLGDKLFVSFMFFAAFVAFTRICFGV